MKAKTIVITGSTRGIGFSLAREFLRTGHQVVINGRHPETVEKAVGELLKVSSQVAGVPGSINVPSTFDDLIAVAGKTFGPVHIWINNAGLPQSHEFFTALKDDEIKQVVETNIYGLMLGTKKAAGFMAGQGFGKIFNMEGFGKNGKIMKKLTLYGTTKRAVHYFTRSMANELEGGPVRIGSLSPGMVRTDLLKISMEKATPAEKKRFEKVYRILAEDADVVAKYLVPEILASKKNYDRIEFLSGMRLAGRIVRLMFAR